MNIKRFCFSVICILLFSILSAQDTDNSKKLVFSTTTDFTYSTKNNYIPGNSHYSHITGIWDSVGLRNTVNIDYTIPAPLGDNFLLKDGHVVINGNIELSPITAAAGTKVTYTPFPFMELQIGAQAGSGWSFGNIIGIGEYNSYSKTYTPKTPFSDLYYKLWAQGILQFDTGAIWEGNWTHIVLQYTYRTYYHNLAKTPKDELWMWQTNKHYYDGWNSYQCLIVAYQMPLHIFRLGGMLEAEHHYTDTTLNSIYKPFKGNFCDLSLSQISQFKFGKKDILSVALTFAKRRSFEEPHTSAHDEPLLTYSGNEWYFKRAALSWTHSF